MTCYTTLPFYEGYHIGRSMSLTLKELHCRYSTSDEHFSGQIRLLSRRYGLYCLLGNKIFELLHHPASVVFHSTSAVVLQH